MDCPHLVFDDGGRWWQQESLGSGVGHWQEGIGRSATALAGSRIGGGQGGGPPQQSQFFMWPIGKINCPLLS